MKKWLTILSAIGITATSSGSVIACTYKTSSPVNYQKFTDINGKNFNKLGEGRVLLYPNQAKTVVVGDQALQQSIKTYYEGDGSRAVKNLVASGFANYSKAVEALNDSSMSVAIQNVQIIDENIYEVSFQIQQKATSFTKKSELLRFMVATGTNYEVLTDDNLATIARSTEIKDDINARNSIFKTDFITTANFLLGLNTAERFDIANNGVMSLNNWFDTTNNVYNQWIAKLKNGGGENPTIYLPGVDSEGRQYQSIRAQINASSLGPKSWRSQFAASVVELILTGINSGLITNSNYQQIGLYQVNALVLPPYLNITNTGVVSSTALESQQNDAN